MTRVYLVRHGATAANRLVPYRLQGRQSDLPLDPIGVEQALRAADVLAVRPISAVYTSPLARALETARAIARSHDLDPISIPDLIEADLGRWEGLTWDDVRARDPDLYDRFMSQPGTVAYPGGESFLDVQRRAGPAIAALVAAHPAGSIAIVGHNILNRAYLAPLLGLSIDRARAIRQANGGINVIDFDGPAIQVVTLNACFHVEEIERHAP